MKNRNYIWYLGYFISLVLVLIIFFANLSKIVNLAMAILFAAIFSISHTQLLHNKMLKNDPDYKINIMDERNIAIKEKAGNITNMVNLVLLGFATVVFICLDYLVPAIVCGAIIAFQPIVLIFVSSMIEKKI